MAAHQWQIGNHLNKQGSAAITVVCAVCGLARVKAIYQDQEQHVDLRGDCPGAAQEPEDDTPPPPAFA